MSFEVDRYSSSWAHIVLCADLTWATEPPDDFILANQRLWANHCTVSQVLRDSLSDSQNSQTNQCKSIENKQSISRQNADNVNNDGRRSVKDVIPESRLAQCYGNFYYDESREKCYTNCDERINLRGCNKQGCEGSDLTECWMLPEVEYWFRKLLDDSTERGLVPRRRHQYIMLPDDDFGRLDPCGSRTSDEEATLVAKLLSVKSLWAKPVRAPSPPPIPRKIRARRRQPKRFNHAPPTPAYRLEAPAQLFCDPTSKFQFDTPSPSRGTECQRAMNRLTASVQAVMRTARCPPYRGTNVSRYAPTGQRPPRCPDRRYARMMWWPRDHLSPRLEQRFNSNHIQQNNISKQSPRTELEVTPESDLKENNTTIQQIAEKIVPDKSPEKPDSPTQKNIATDQQPSTSTAMDTDLRKKRLYSTVLSMNAPTPINLAQIGCVRLAQKLITPGLIKLNPKIVLPTSRVRPPNVDHKFEELEKEALEQYKASDESIETKFQELEEQAVEQYSTSNSNTSCSSGNSAEKKKSNALLETETKKKPAKFCKEKPVDSVVIYSQHFPDLNSKTSSAMNLKNFLGPPRGEKKNSHRQNKIRNRREQRAASDTDFEARQSNFKNHKGPVRRTLHVVPPKKRHLTICMSDFSSDEDIASSSLRTKSIKDTAPRIKNHVSGKKKLSAHGGGDLHPIMRKT